MHTMTHLRVQKGHLTIAKATPRPAVVVRTLTGFTRDRGIHSSPKDQVVALPITLASPLSPRPVSSGTRSTSALSTLPFSQVLRTYLITSISSSSVLLDASSTILRRMLSSNNVFFDVDKNPVLRAILRATFYKQFCAGNDAREISHACQELRSQGYAGVILEYALEVLKDAESNEVHDVSVWRTNLLKTIEMTVEGDFVGLKWSGMGSAAMRLMAKNAPPTEAMCEAMNAVCAAAARKGVALLPAAEETWTLDGFHNWSMAMQRAYNTGGRSVVYTTYQAYLKRAPEILSLHLDEARQNNFSLGAKLVRGAYLGTDDRNMIHPNIEATHNAYDTIAEALIKREYNQIVEPRSGATSVWPQVNVVLATHNAISVQKAQALRSTQAARGEQLTPLAFAQLQGMADEVSCKLIAATNEAREIGNTDIVQEKVYKCTTWGSMKECLNYLLRRAAENKDAASRTSDTRKAMAAELRRRLRTMFTLT